MGDTFRIIIYKYFVQFQNLKYALACWVRFKIRLKILNYRRELLKKDQIFKAHY